MVALLLVEVASPLLKSKMLQLFCPDTQINMFSFVSLFFVSSIDFRVKSLMT